MATLQRAPGLAVVAAVTMVAYAINGLISSVSTLVVAVVLGAVIGNIGSFGTATQPGLTFAGRQLLRTGIVLLGLRLSVGHIVALGPTTVLLVVVTVTATFFGTRALGRWLGLSEGLSLLVATGYSICGASAIAAMESSSDADEDEVAVSIGVVTLAGTVAMFALPALGSVLGLGDTQFATWVGASVHDVAQVVAAASTRGSEVLALAIVVKLTRVVLLAPTVAAVAVHRSKIGERDALGGGRPPLMPMFVVAFLAAVVVRSIGVLPMFAVDGAAVASGVLLTAAMVGLGSGVRVDRLRAVGAGALMLGAMAWVVVAGVSLGATYLLV